MRAYIIVIRMLKYLILYKILQITMLKYLLCTRILLLLYSNNIHCLKVYEHSNNLNTFYDFNKVSNNWNTLTKLYSTALYSSNYDILPNNNSSKINIDIEYNKDIKDAKKEYTCQVCSNKFLSRNKLFQHFYHSDCTTELVSLGLNNNNSVVNNLSQYDDRQSIQLRIGYSSRINNQKLNKILTNAILKVNQDTGLHHNISISRSSSNSFRKSMYLIQDMNVNAIGDVMIYSEPISIHNNKSIAQWIFEVNQELANSNHGYANIIVLSKSIIPKHMKLHAEQHCTSRIYTFLLPLSILLTNTNNNVPSVTSGTEYSTLLSNTAILDMNVQFDTSRSTYNPSSSSSSSLYVLNRQMKAILREIIGPKLAEKGGYRWRKGKEQQELRSIRRWHNYYRPYHTSEESSGYTDHSWTPIVPSTDRVVLRTLDRLYAEGILNITIKASHQNSSNNIYSIAQNKASHQNSSNNYSNTYNSSSQDTSDFNNPIEGVVIDNNINLTSTTTASTTNEVIALIEVLPLKLIGDGFLTGQVRSIVGLLVAVYHGWLPKEFIEYSQRRDIVTEVPCIPPHFNLMMLSEARFDWHPSVINNNSNASNSELVGNYSIDFENKIYQEIAMEAIERERSQQYNTWLVELRDIVCPRILQQYEKSYLTILNDNNDNSISIVSNNLHSPDQRLAVSKQPMEYNNTNDNSNSITNNSSNFIILRSEVPVIYHKVLSLLRTADASGLWPTTTKARQRVIKTTTVSSSSPRSAMTTEHTHNHECDKVGSFSVGRPVQSKNTPRGNILFEELVEAVFELEMLLINTTNVANINTNTRTNASINNTCTTISARKMSRMAAINRRAQFLPHKDAGAGFGQSQSLIVGLGDYTGGGLSVEGRECDIRYQPLEFDGWKQMHWTLPFKGERYSIVWFTPADSED